MAVAIRPMRDDEFEVWLPSMRDGYAAQMIDHAGYREEAARAKAEEDTSALFPGGKPAADQWIYVVEADGEPVGDLWLAEREIDRQRTVWVYDVRIDDEHRGRGFGKAAMLIAEDEARRRGIDRVALNVFGGNEVARKLYRSLGYAEQAVFMGKTVE